MVTHNMIANKMDPPGLYMVDGTGRRKLQGGNACIDNSHDGGTSEDEVPQGDDHESVGMHGKSRLSRGDMMARCVLCPRPSSEAIIAVEQHLEFAEVQVKQTLARRSDFRDGKREKLREYLKCLDGIYQHRGTSDTFIHLFKEMYAVAQKEHFLPREDGERRVHCIHQIWQNVKKSFEKHDYSHFTWFMYMFMKFMLEQEEASGGKKDAAAVDGDDEGADKMST